MKTKNVYLYADEAGMERVRDIPQSIGYAAWNMAVTCSPFDTGNLRNSITLGSNTNRKVNIRYNLMNANYIEFLEKGQGNVKQYKGFISELTLTNILEIYVNYIENGWSRPLASAPTISLKSSSNIFSGEKKILRSFQIDNKKISANMRRQISNIREKEYRLWNDIKFSQVRGERANTNLGVDRNIWNKSNRGISKLNKYNSTLKKYG